MSQRDRYEGEIDGHDPGAYPDRRSRSGTAGSVNIDFCGGAPGAPISGFGKGQDTHILSREGGEGRRLERGVIDPGPDGYRCKVDAVETTYEAYERRSLGVTRNFHLPELNNVFTDSAVGFPILSRKISYAANETGSLHVNCGIVGQWYKYWFVLRVPKRGGVAVDGVSP